MLDPTIVTLTGTLTLNAIALAVGAIVGTVTIVCQAIAIHRQKSLLKVRDTQLRILEHELVMQKSLNRIIKATTQLPVNDKSHSTYSETKGNSAPVPVHVVGDNANNFAAALVGAAVAVIAFNSTDQSCNDGNNDE